MRWDITDHGAASFNNGDPDLQAAYEKLWDRLRADPLNQGRPLSPPKKLPKELKRLFASLAKLGKRYGGSSARVAYEPVSGTPKRWARSVHIPDIQKNGTHLLVLLSEVNRLGG
jgi:hypothetical protein